MRPGDLLFSNPALQPLVYRWWAGLNRCTGLVFQRSGAVLRSDAPMVLIVGCGRSGNTLLRRVLMERGSIYIPPESYVWASQALALLRGASLSWEEQVALALGKLEYMREFETFPVVSLREFALEASEWPVEHRSLGRLIHELYFWLAAQLDVSADWVGDKTPMNLARVGLVGRVFPNARYIYIERDPVDVAASYRAAGLCTLGQAARRWKLSHEAWRRFRKTTDPARRVEVKFDELSSDPDAECDRILDAIGITSRPQPLNVSDLLGDVNMREHHRSVRAGQRQRERSHGRSQLTSAELSILRSVLGHAPERAGYDPV